MILHSKMLAVSSLWIFCAVALPAVAAPAGLSELKTHLNGLPSIESKLEFLKTGLLGQTNEVKATLGAALIQSAPAANQKEVAKRVAEILAGLKDGSSNTAKLIGLLTSKLPQNLAPSLAGSIAIGAGKSDPQHLPQFTAAVIVSQSSTIDHAGPIAEEVTASAPLDMGSRIASAIGAAFVDNPQLVKQAPQIAADITIALLPKGTTEQTRPEIANSVAALIVLLPGSISSNKDLITSVGKAVAAVIANSHSGMATTIVGITSAALKSAAGSSDISSVLNNFQAAFADAIDDPIIKDKLAKVVSQINAGTSDKSILPLEPKITSDPQVFPTPPPTGPVVPPETNVVNH